MDLQDVGPIDEPSGEETWTSPRVIFIVEGQHIDLMDAILTDPDSTREALIHGLSRVPLDNSHLSRIQAQEHLRRSVTAKRDITPYRLSSTLNECKNGGLESETLEAKLYRAGGAWAVAAYAAALVDNKEVESLVTSLSDAELGRLARSIPRSKTTVHPDFRYLTERAQRIKPRVTKKKHLARPLRRRGTGLTAEKPNSVSGYEQGMCIDHPSAALDPGRVPITEIPKNNGIDDLSHLAMPNYHEGLTIPRDHEISVVDDDLDQFNVPDMFSAHFGADPSSLDFAAGFRFSE